LIPTTLKQFGDRPVADLLKERWDAPAAAAVAAW